MITVDTATFFQLLRIVRASTHDEAPQAFRRLQKAALEMIERDDSFDNEAPALCRRQAG